MLPIIFRDIHFFQRYGEHPACYDFVVIEAVRQQDTALTFGDLRQSAHGAGHILQRLLQGGKTVMDIQDLLFCQNLAVVKEFLQVDGGVLHIIVQIL